VVSFVALWHCCGSWWPAHAGGARQRLTFFARAKKVSKENTPRFAALRVPELDLPDWAAAQLGLRPQTVLADYPQSDRPISAAQRGLDPLPHPTLPHEWGRAREGDMQRSHSVHAGFNPTRVAYATHFFPLQPEPRFPGLAGGCRRKVSERSEFFRRPAESGKLGVSTDVGRVFFGDFLCTSKESHAPPGAPGLSRSANRINPIPRITLRSIRATVTTATRP
jgi:hypothetical protein